MDYEDLIEAIRLCGSTPSVDQCLQCVYWGSGDMQKCIPRMTGDAAAAIETLQAKLAARDKLVDNLETENYRLQGMAQGNDHHATWYDIGASGAHCSRCHYRAPQQSRYCPHCGAKMERREKP